MACESSCQATHESSFLWAEISVAAFGNHDLQTALKKTLGCHAELDEGSVSRRPTIRIPHEDVFSEMPVSCQRPS